MANVELTAPTVNQELLAELAELANGWKGLTRHVARAILERWRASPLRFAASAASLAADLGCARITVLRALRRLARAGIIARIGAKTSAWFRLLVLGASDPPPGEESEAPTEPPPPMEEEDTEPSPPDGAPLSRTETAVCLAVRNARDEALLGPEGAAELVRGRRVDEPYPGGFSTLERARRVASWVLKVAAARGEFWETLANHLGRWYVYDERTKASFAFANGCPVDFIAHDGGRRVLKRAGIAWDARRRAERERVHRQFQRPPPPPALPPVSSPPTMAMLARELAAKIGRLAGL